MNNKSHIFKVSSSIVYFVIFIFLTPTINAETTELIEQQKLTSNIMTNLFLEYVDQKGGLLIFGSTLKRSDLQSHQVSYVHNIADDSLVISLCFKLLKVVLVPEFEEYYVERVTVEMDKDGNIIKIKTGVSPVSK